MLYQERLTTTEHFGNMHLMKFIQLYQDNLSQEKSWDIFLHTLLRNGITIPTIILQKYFYLTMLDS